MKTTIDHAGRLVIPKHICRESGIKPGMPLEVRWENGAIAITPAPVPVTLERKGRLLLAVPSKDTPRLSSETAEQTRKSLRNKRSGETQSRINRQSRGRDELAGRYADNVSDLVKAKQQSLSLTSTKRMATVSKHLKEESILRLDPRFFRPRFFRQIFPPRFSLS